MSSKRSRLRKGSKRVLPTTTQVSSTQMQVSTLLDLDPEELPPPPNIEETLPESPIVENDFQNPQNDDEQANESFLLVPAFEDYVVIEENGTVPKFLRYDYCLQKYVFQISKFDYNTDIEKHNLNNKEYVKKLSWNKFSLANSKLLLSYCQELSHFYKYGFSVKFMRNFCSGLATKLPACEKKYHRIKKESAKGKLEPDLSKTSKQFDSFSDFLFSRMKHNTRYHVRKAAKDQNKKLKVKKHNSHLVADRNRKRKKSTTSSVTEH